MSDTSDLAADYFLSALESYGIDTIFGNPGTTELPLMKSLENHSLDYVLA
ncbi:MAG: thiamine pyrophosphate-binding protein, partial [bacterium]